MLLGRGVANDVGESPGEISPTREVQQAGLAKVEIMVTVAGDVDVQQIKHVDHVVAVQNGSFQGGREGIAAEDAQRTLAVPDPITDNVTRIAEYRGKPGQKTRIRCVILKPLCKPPVPPS